MAAKREQEAAEAKWFSGPLFADRGSPPSQALESAQIPTPAPRNITIRGLRIKVRQIRNRISQATQRGLFT